MVIGNRVFVFYLFLLGCAIGGFFLPGCVVNFEFLTRISPPSHRYYSDLSLSHRLYSLQLINVMLISKDLYNIVRCIGDNTTSLLWVCYLFLITMFIYAIWGKL